MNDPILDEIWRVRRQLLREHGGIEGYVAYVARLDRSHNHRRSSGLGSLKRKRGTHPQPAK
jgi:hypothetical protein